MLQKMGWSSGQGLGRSGQGIIKPIEVITWMIIRCLFKTIKFLFKLTWSIFVGIIKYDDDSVSYVIFLLWYISILGLSKVN